jgi:hypothetical protein
MSIKDFLPWQRLTSNGDSQTTPQPSNLALHVGHTHGGWRHRPGLRLWALFKGTRPG